MTYHILIPCMAHQFLILQIEYKPMTKLPEIGFQIWVSNVFGLERPLKDNKIKLIMTELINASRGKIFIMFQIYGEY